MLRIKMTPTEFQALSIGCFLMGSMHLKQLLGGYGRWRKASNRLVKSAKFSTVKDSTPVPDLTTALHSAEPRKKSSLYTKTGDKGMSSVSHLTLLRLRSTIVVFKQRTCYVAIQRRAEVEERHGIPYAGSPGRAQRSDRHRQ
jgi:hypothetical protein